MKARSRSALSCLILFGATACTSTPSPTAATAGTGVGGAGDAGSRSLGSSGSGTAAGAPSMNGVGGISGASGVADAGSGVGGSAGSGALAVGGGGAAGQSSVGGSPGVGGSAGSSGQSGATAGAAAVGGDPFLGDVTPAKNGDLWRLTLGDVVFEVNAAKGASVTTFALGGHNVLADGSQFRPSPQKTWNWPPPAEIAQSAYTASMSGKVVVMESQTNTQWGVKAKKRFWANAANQVVTIEYTLTNTAATRASWGPWEVSRVNPTGLTFFPEGTAIAAKPASYGTLLSLQSAAGVAWLDYQTASYTSGGYIVARDGSEGWSAHAESGVLFIKSFPDITAAQIPPEEGEVQLWTDDTHVALEMENEGAYVPIDAGQSIVWTMRWYLRAIPSDATASVGNANLLTYVRSQLLK